MRRREDLKPNAAVRDILLNALAMEVELRSLGPPIFELTYRLLSEKWPSEMPGRRHGWGRGPIVSEPR